MSVTFTFGWTMDDGVTCTGLVCEHTCPEPDTCEDHLVYGYCSHISDAKAECLCSMHDVNVSNTNAIAVLNRLGFDVDPECLYGEADPADFLGRAMLANVGLADDGFVDVATRGELGATMIECGVRPGYFTDRMERLADLAVVAAKHGYKVAWC